MIYNFCKYNLRELSKHKIKDKEALFLSFVAERLDMSYSTSEKELQQSLEYLKAREELRVLKRMNKLL